jgi:hypothetical protein
MEGDGLAQSSMERLTCSEPIPAENLVDVVSGVGLAGNERHGCYPRIDSINSPFMSAFLVRLTGSNRTDQPHHCQDRQHALQ